MFRLQNSYLIKILFLTLLTYLFISTFPQKYTINYTSTFSAIPTKKISSTQIFFKNNSGIYSEKKSKLIINNYTKDKHQISFYYSSYLDILRIDPLQSKGLIEINNLQITYKYFTYYINLEKVFNLIDIELLDSNLTTFSLKSISSDPHFEISTELPYIKIFLLDLLYSIIISVILIFAFKLLLLKENLHTLLLSAILFIYTLFVLSGVYWGVAIFLIYIFSLFSMLYFISTDYKNKLPLIKKIIIVLAIYFSLAYSTLLTGTDLANACYLNSKFPLIISSFIIIISFYRIPNFNVSYFKRYLTSLLLLFAFIIILLNNKVIILDYYIDIFDITIGRNPATQKNYMFWYVLLFFGTLSFYQLKERKDAIIISILVFISYCALFNGYSHSARLSFSIGLIIYILFSYIHVKKKTLLILIWIMTLYIILSPLIFSLIDLTPYHHRLISRDAIYHTAAALIKEHWLFGYGFGSTLDIDIRDFVNRNNFPEHYINSFRGGHPHNLALLFWIEFGIFGAIFLAYFVHKLLLYLVTSAYRYSNFPAIISLFISFDIITSFSWSIWYPQVLLTYTFFGSLLLLSLSISNNQRGNKI